MDAMHRKFLKLLSLEMESLKDELELIIDSLDSRLARREITDYVRNDARVEGHRHRKGRVLRLTRAAER